MSETEFPLDAPTMDPSLNTSANLTRYSASREALVVAYSSMLIMAITPIIIGSIRSVAFHIMERDSGKKLEDTDIITKKKALLFPFYASAVLVSFYLIFKYLPPDIVNLFISLVFTWLGVVSMSFFIEQSIVNRGFPQVQLFLAVRHSNHSAHYPIIRFPPVYLGAGITWRSIGLRTTSSDSP